MKNKIPELIFVIGFPRSGTKLLLEILKSSSKIGGVDSEINLAHKVNNSKNHKSNIKNVFYQSTISENLNELSVDLFFDSLKNKKCNVENYKNLLAFINQKKEAKYIVDKSPRYISYLDKLIKTFPNSKFIHIIRNPIDVAISHKKVWNKSIIRTSSQWKKTNKHLILPKYRDKVLTIKYEDLTLNPEKTVSQLSFFLKISNDFVLNKVNSGEKYGNIKVKGVKKNQNRIGISEKQIKSIEEYSFTTMQDFDYHVNFAKREKKRTLLMSIFLIFWDKSNVLLFHLKEKGILKGIKYYMKLQN